MPKLKVITVFGTRPEAIKMAPIVQRLKQCHDQFNEVTVVTGQHREMLDQVLTTFHIKPDYDLNIMKARQTLADITSNVILQLGQIIEGGEANCPTRRSFLPHSVLKLTPLGERIDQEFQKWHR